MGLFSLFRRKPHERTGFLLYGQAVAAARDPWFYGTLGVPDTLDGRFDTVGLHAILLIQRLRTDPDPVGQTLAQAVFDAMFADMDQNLRQMGVGDLSVGKKNRAMWEAFHGRARAYEPALAAGDSAALGVALLRNIWRQEPNPEAPAAAVSALTVHALATARALAAQPLAGLLRGEARFPPTPGQVADAA
jgi:cytochrome b pre-mRNA-processing protein 3